MCTRLVLLRCKSSILFFVCVQMKGTLLFFQNPCVKVEPYPSETQKSEFYVAHQANFSSFVSYFKRRLLQICCPSVLNDLRYHRILPDDKTVNTPSIS